MARKSAIQQPGVEEKLIELSRLPDQEIFSRFRTSEEGLNQVEAGERLDEYGRNIIDTGNENNLFKRVREAIINPFNIVLLVVAGVTLATDVIIAENPNWATFLMRVFVILISGVISFVQSEKSNSAAQKLQRMISNKIDVIRNGSEMEIDIEEAVPGDIVKLASGDMIPGDVRFIETKDLFIDQSQLTGESNPVEKFAGVDNEGDAIAELDNIGFMGSNVVSGSAKAVVLATGNQTYFDENNLEGIRVIAVAQKNDVNGVETFGVDDESNMVLIGFVGFLDPPKPSAESAITALNRNGVRTVVLTGDTEGVAINICGRLGIPTDYTLTGVQVEAMDDGALREACEKCHIFSKLSPYQKQRVVKAFQANGHTVGYMGDGINDSLPLKQADVGISVDTAVDIAKEVADIILLEKDLNVLDAGVIEGRRTFANMSKYLKMSVSGNFGNMFSVLIASIFLPFLPLLPLHILVQNILNDFAQLGMPFDHVEDEYIRLPKKWDIPGIKKFMVCFGLLSTVLDVLCFLVMWHVFKFNSTAMAGYFQCGWFMFGVISQTMVIHTIRTPKIPFIQDRASPQLTLSTALVVLATLLIGFTAIAGLFDLPVMVPAFGLWLVVLMAVYTLLAQVLKGVYIRINREWV